MMLEQLVAKVRQGGTLETRRLAAELDTSVGLVEAMLDHLQRQGVIRGYIRCSDGCAGCGLQSNCAGASEARIWQSTSDEP